MVVETSISNEAYERLALAEPDRKWELRDGHLREKPGMTWEHSAIAPLLSTFLVLQIDRSKHQVLSEIRVRSSAGTILIPDIVVASIDAGHDLRGRPGKLAILTSPLPLVIEIWSLSTGGYDIAGKVPEYQRRGDLEIWSIHPYERILTAWRRQENGTYVETIFRERVVRVTALPDVTIDLEELFNG